MHGGVLRSLHNRKADAIAFDRAEERGRGPGSPPVVRSLRDACGTHLSRVWWCAEVGRVGPAWPFGDGTLVSPIELCEQCGRWWAVHPATKQLAAVFDVEFPDE
jgi:hypothetical protein